MSKLLTSEIPVFSEECVSAPVDNLDIDEEVILNFDRPAPRISTFTDTSREGLRELLTFYDLLKERGEIEDD